MEVGLVAYVVLVVLPLVLGVDFDPVPFSWFVESQIHGRLRMSLIFSLS